MIIRLRRLFDGPVFCQGVALIFEHANAGIDLQDLDAETTVLLHDTLAVQKRSRLCYLRLSSEL